MIHRPIRFRHVLWAVAVIVLLYVAYAAWVVVVRVRFPYDHLIWAESPFLTNMLKLHNGVELYGPPADANSFVYSPGLEYLCHTLLSPLGLNLDVRACRVVNVAVALVAVGAAAHFMRSLLDVSTDGSEGDGPDRGRDRWAVRVLFVGAAALVLVKNLAFDICHPDNLHALHLAGGIALAYHAMRRHSFGWALGTSALLGGGILLKQTCALGGVGVGLYLALWGRREWGARRSALLVAAPVVVTAFGAWWLLIHQEHGRYWLLEVLLRHPKAITKLDYLWAYEAAFLHRAPLYLGAVLFALRSLLGDREKVREATGLWLFAGLFGVSPALSAYVKEFGLFNNIIVIDLWAAMLVLPSLVALAHRELERRADSPLGIVAAATLVVIGLGLYPTKRQPLRDHWRYGRELEAALREDRAASRRVLVAHGTAAWLRAGLRDVPRDRSNSVLELDAAHRADDAETAARFAARHYDRIYVGWPRYADDMEEALRKHYRKVGTIAPVSLPDKNTANGWSVEMVAPIAIYAPR
jgi:hypothetical protein